MNGTCAAVARRLLFPSPSPPTPWVGCPVGWAFCGEPRLEPRCLSLYSVRDGRIITRPPCAHRGITAIGEIPTIRVPAPWMIPSRSRLEPTRQLGEASHLCHLSRRRRPLTARASDPGHLPVRGRIAIPPGARQRREANVSLRLVVVRKRVPRGRIWLSETVLGDEVGGPARGGPRPPRTLQTPLWD